MNYYKDLNLEMIIIEDLMIDGIFEKLINNGMMNIFK